VNPASSKAQPPPRGDFPRRRKLKPTTCAVCNHAERERIEALRSAGASLEALGRKFGVSADSVFRHWKSHVSSDLKMAYLAGPGTIAQLKEKAVQEGASVLDYLTILRSVLMGSLTASAKANSAHTLAAISGRLVEVLREIGKITGEVERLNPSSVNVVTNVAVMTDQRMIELQSGLLTIARTHPEARADIVALLRGLDSRPAMAKPNGAGHPPMIEAEAVHVS